MKELNVTTIEPRNRHPLIFSTFDGLQKGEELVLTNDHDPKPLYYSLLHERDEQRKQAAIKTDSACSLTKCTTHYQCVDAADAAKYRK